jgi:hypothetical protein
MRFSRTAIRRVGGLLTGLAAAALLTAGCGVRHTYYAPAPPVVVVPHYGPSYGYGGGPTVVHVHHYGSGYGGHTIVVHHYH